MTEMVASTKLRDAPWGTFPAATITHDPVATIRELKQQSGKDIWLWGSLTLMQYMFDADVVDEVQLRVCATTRGKGTYMFKDPRDMHLIEAKSFENGVVLLRYDIKK
jgi:dihydrofolate reductase